MGTTLLVGFGSARRRGALCLSAVLVLGALGCGLGDYEQRIDRQKERLKRVDKENQVLGEPLNNPMKPDGSEPLFPFEFFLRPPKDIDSTPMEKPYVFGNVQLYAYPSAAQTGKGVAAYVLLAITGMSQGKESNKDTGELTADDFRHKVRGALLAFARATNADQPVPDLKNLVKKGPKELGGKLDFDVVSSPAPAAKAAKFHWEICFHHNKDASMQAAVIYQMQGEKLDRSILEMSLGTFALGDDATRKWHYLRRPR